MPKVYLSPAYHYWNPCAVAGCDETTHNNLYLDVLEPYLIQQGFLQRTPRGRMATVRAWNHFGITPPAMP